MTIRPGHFPGSLCPSLCSSLTGIRLQRASVYCCHPHGGRTQHLGVSGSYLLGLPWVLLGTHSSQSPANFPFLTAPSFLAFSLCLDCRFTCLSPPSECELHKGKDFCLTHPWSMEPWLRAAQQALVYLNETKGCTVDRKTRGSSRPAHCLVSVRTPCATDVHYL